jgi:hypothetical protein
LTAFGLKQWWLVVGAIWAGLVEGRRDRQLAGGLSQRGKQLRAAWFSGVDVPDRCVR